MTPEARILAAFWNRNQGRFCELTGEEVKHRSGLDVNGDAGKTLIQDGSVQKFDTHQGMLYRLSRDGEARVTAMIVMGTLPKTVFRLTAVPPKPNTLARR